MIDLSNLTYRSAINHQRMGLGYLMFVIMVLVYHCNFGQFPGLEKSRFLEKVFKF